MNNLRNILFLFILKISILSCSDKSNYLDLGGTSWKVETIIENNQVVLKSRPKTYILKFIDDDSYYIVLDVNTCGGKYSVLEKKNIDFSPTGCTEVCCDSEYANMLVNLIQCTNYYTIKKGRLYLYSDGTIILQRH